jgi:molybdate transport system permease protein
MVLAFARGLGEFGATAIIAGNMEGTTRTIALAVYTLLDAPDGDAAMRELLAASIGLSLAALVLFEALNRSQRRRFEWDRG